jgi:endoglucanase
LDFEILKKYTELPGPLGLEERVQKVFMKDLKPFTDDIQLNNVGNVIAHFPGKGRKVIIFGHADEIAYYVLSITEEGFLHIVSYFSRTIKVTYPYSLVGQKALVLGDSMDVRGVFAAPSAHVLQEQERYMPLEDWKVLVDIGASSSEEVAELGIHVGSPIIWNPTTERLGKKKVFGKAMDDRIAHVILLELAKRLEGNELGCDLYMASTVQEEISLKGAQDLARGGYDVSMAIDVGIAGDYPLLEKGRMPIRLGDEPCNRI